MAEIGIQAALTGHLVFSTLHTNDALGALPRLAQLGVDPQTFSRAINVILAQRLVRSVCTHCSEQHPLTPEQKTEIERRIKLFPESYRQETFDIKKIRRTSEASKNCKKCSDGYTGRIGIFEIFEIDDKVERAYRSEGGIDALREAIRNQGLPFMEDDALWKTLKGDTTLDELRRVLGLVI